MKPLIPTFILLLWPWQQWWSFKYLQSKREWHHAQGPIAADKLLCNLTTQNLTFNDNHIGTRDWHGRERQNQSWMWTGRLPSGGQEQVCNGWGCLPSLSSSCSDLGCVQEGTLPPGFCLHSQNAAGNFLQGNNRDKLSTAHATLWNQTLTVTCIINASYSCPECICYSRCCSNSISYRQSWLVN